LPASASIASASDNKMAELQEEMRQTELDLAIVQTLEDRRATLIATLEDQRATLEDQRATCQEIIKLKSEKGENLFTFQFLWFEFSWFEFPWLEFSWLEFSWFAYPWLEFMV
jgi:hypothetical protein